MDQETDLPASRVVAMALNQAINDLLAEGESPLDIAFWLSYMGQDLALQRAPSGVHAALLVTTAQHLAAKDNLANRVETATAEPRDAIDSRGTASGSLAVGDGSRVIH